MDMDKYIGRLLDNRYEILEVLGMGGQAVVYKARCHRLNRLVAIKILKSEFSQDEEFRRRFHAESQAVAMLSHPNIVSVYDVSTNSEADYIVMELVDGISLKQYMEMKGVLNWKETLHFAIQIAKALEHAHSRGIVHRDIKPHNIMVLKNGSVKVTDFGIARIMSKSNTLTKEALGSVHYISPEQAKGGRVDNRSDIYSLGVVMYEMMTGRPPYDGESPVAVAIQHINGGAQMPSVLNPNIPGGLEQIIMKAMAHDPNDRYDSATAMLRDMDEFRKEPTMLFDYNTPPLDDVTKLQRTIILPEPIPEVQPPKTTAERVAAGKSGVNSSHRAAGERIHTGNTGRLHTGTGSLHTGNTGRVPVNGAGASRNAAPGRSTASGRSAAPGRNMASRSGNANRRPPEERAMGERTTAARQRRREAEEKSNRVATIAIVVCSVVAIIAIAVFLISLFGGNSVTSSPEKAPVPPLVGKVYDELPATYEGFSIQLAEYAYSEQYEKGKIMLQKPESGEKVKKDTIIYVTVSKGPEKDKNALVMDNLIKTEASGAVAYLRGKGLDPQIQEVPSETVDKGYIISTDPVQGKELTPGQTVTLWVSTGPEKNISVPNLKNRELSAAESILMGMGLKTDVEEEYSEEVDKGHVIRTEPGRDVKLSKGDTVKLIVSSGPEFIKEYMPNVVGLSVTTAQSVLDAKGFDKVTVEVVESDAAKDEVVRQSEKAETKIDVNTTIILYVSKGPKETQPPTTPPTTPPATNPPDVEVTKTVTITLPDNSNAPDSDKAEDITVTIRLKGEDKDLYKETCSPTAKSIQVKLTGSGVQEYDIYIKGIFFKTEKVDFRVS